MKLINSSTPNKSKNQKVRTYFIYSIAFIFISFFFFTSASAQTYYVSNSDGNDTCTGLAETAYTTGATACPIKTLTKLNTKTFSPGDSILFKKGDTFYGSITVSQSGTSGNPITFSSYGTSNEKPIITGFTDVTEWTNKGANIWESTNAVSTLSTLNMVTVNGVNTAMGRWPNADASNGGYATFQSHVGKTSITSSLLTGTPNWTGAESVIRTSRWTLDRTAILSQSGSTITINSNITYEPRDRYGFFIQNDSRTLDQQNEWYYNPTTKKLSMYSTSQPVNVKVASVSNLLNTNGSYIIIDGIGFIGANSYSIYNISVQTNLTIQNCKISFTGINGIHLQNNHLLIDNCTVTESNNNGIDLSNGVPYATITNTTVENSGIFAGMGLSGIATRSGISSRNASNIETTVEYSRVINSGYNGIIFYGDYAFIKNNFVDTFAFVLDDGGGIYTYTGSAPEKNQLRVEGNIVLNGIGAPISGIATAPNAYGIYFDSNTTQAEAFNNTVSGCNGGGINFGLARYINIHDNTFFDNYYGMSAGGVPETTYGIKVTNNQFIAKTSSQYVLRFSNWAGDHIEFDAINNNYYAKPIDDNLSFYIRYGGTVDDYFDFAYWKVFTGQDTNSHTSPVTITDVNDLNFEYNATTSNRVVSLFEPMIDVTGTKYTGSVTLLPYTSIVLIKDPNPTPPSDTTAPTISSFSIPTTSTTLTISPITLSATDTSGIGGYLLNETGTTPNAGSGPWQSTSPTTHTFTTAGTKTLYAFAKDTNGNVSTPSSDTITITLPVVVTPSGGGGGGGSYTPPPTTTITCPTGSTLSNNTCINNTTLVITTPTLTTTPTITTVQPSTPSYTFTTRMTLGTKGTEVLKLQEILISQGYLTGTADGSYGPKTLTAVKAFQRAFNLTPDGIIGIQGRAILNSNPSDEQATITPTYTPTIPTLPTTSLLTDKLVFRSKANNISQVKLLQTILTSKGYLSGTIDGIFGRGTLSAVKSFQLNNNLTPDGIVGAKSREMLNR